MPDLLIKVSRDLAKKLNSLEDELEGELGRVLARYGARLHRSPRSDEESTQYFLVEQVAGDRMDALRQDLAGLPEVEAAYMKPDAELP